MHWFATANGFVLEEEGVVRAVSVCGERTENAPGGPLMPPPLDPGSERERPATASWILMKNWRLMRADRPDFPIPV